LVLFAFPLENSSAETQSQKIAGTYWIDILPDGAVEPIPGLLVLTADGRIMAVEQLPFEAGGYGNWQKVGDRGAKGRFLGFTFDSSGAATGVLEVVFDGEFDQSSDYGELPFEISFYDADQNPLDEDPVFGPFPGVMFLRRIPAD
jgi:hypothetical protein